MARIERRHLAGNLSILLRKKNGEKLFRNGKEKKVPTERNSTSGISVLETERISKNKEFHLVRDQMDKTNNNKILT